MSLSARCRLDPTHARRQSTIMIVTILFSTESLSFKQKRAYEVRISDWSSDVCSSDLMLDRARVAGGERVLITGASGGVGSGLVQLCRARGAIPYAVVGPGKEQAVLDIGAEAVITRGPGDLVAAVERATGGRPIDVLADLVGGTLFNYLLRNPPPHGRH